MWVRLIMIKGVWKSSTKGSEPLQFISIVLQGGLLLNVSNLSPPAEGASHRSSSAFPEPTGVLSISPEPSTLLHGSHPIGVGALFPMLQGSKYPYP